MPASMIVGRGEAKAVIKELAYLLSRLCTLDATTMRVRVRKRPSCAAICGRCDAALARFLADPPGIALAV